MFKFKGRTSLINEPLYIDVIMTVFVAPILEEIVFRGVIMNNLKKYGIRVAIIINSLLFGLSHYNVEMIIPAFLTGIIFSYVACKYSIKYSILIHFLLNTITQILQVIILSKIEILIVSIGLFFIFLVIFLSPFRSTLFPCSSTYYCYFRIYLILYTQIYLLLLLIKLIIFFIFKILM